MNKSNEASTVKKKSLIRWEALIPFTLVCALIGLYFHFFFDTHLRKAIEWVGYKAVGAEVNISELSTSFLNANIRIQQIEITDAEKPTHNSIKVGDIRFGMSWDALLRAKVLIKEAVVEQIEFGTIRKHPGKVQPPEPVKEDGPGLSDKIKEQALKEAQEQSGENVLGDVIAMLSGGDAQGQLDKLQNNLPSKAMIEKFDAELKQKQTLWDQKLKSLPQSKDIQALGDRLNKVKYKDFKDAQELQTSLQELDKIYKQGDTLYKQVQSTSDELSGELKKLESQYKDIEAQVRTDIKTLEQHFRIPKLDAKAMTMAVFNKYLAPYKAKFYRYKSLADKYLPPNLMKKNTDKDEIVIQPHPREKGITYEFGRPNSYPLFWIQRTAVSSQAGTSPEAGNIKGEILDITSNQHLVGKPTIANLAGDFPGMQIFGFLLQLSLDNTKDESIVKYKFNVNSYAIQGKELLQSPDVTIAFNKAKGSMDLAGQIVGLKNVTLQMNNKFTDVDYLVSSKNEIADQILKTVFTGLPSITLAVEGDGKIPNVPLSINSNLGPELQRGFEKQIQAKIDDAKKRVQDMINQEVGKQKAQIDAQISKLRGQFEGEVKKAQAQLDTEKKSAESKVDQAKKDAENQAKKGLEKEGQKAVEDLKKKLGW